MGNSHWRTLEKFVGEIARAVFQDDDGIAAVIKKLSVIAEKPSAIANAGSSAVGITRTPESYSNGTSTQQ